MGAFYVSYPTTLLLSIPYQSVHFASYEAIKSFLNPSGKYDPKSHIVAGGMAGAAASLFTQPLDVIKTVLQTKGVSSEEIVRNASGFKDAFYLIYTKQGWTGFFRGLYPRLATQIPATAICWTTYEFMKMFLSSRPMLMTDSI